MLDRYSRKVMRDIWSEEAQYQAWLDVEIMIDEAWSKLGEVPEEDVEKIRKNASGLSMKLKLMKSIKS